MRLVQPTAMKLGRMFAYLATTLVSIEACIVGFEAHFVALSPGESDRRICWCTCRLSRRNFNHQHLSYQERTSYVSWFVLSLYAGSDLGPVRVAISLGP